MAFGPTAGSWAEAGAAATAAAVGGCGALLRCIGTGGLVGGGVARPQAGEHESCNGDDDQHRDRDLRRGA